MRSMIAILVVSAAACGGSKKPVEKPVAKVEAPPPEPVKEEPPPPPPPPQLPGWYADAEYTVVLADDGSATIQNKKKKKSVTGTWDGTVNTMTIGDKSSPIKLEDEKLTFTTAAGDKTLARQPAGFKGENYEYKKSEKDFGSLQLNEDGSCVHGTKGIPAPCKYTLDKGTLTVTDDDKPKKPTVWVVWFEDGGKTMHTPKLDYKITGGE
ncbi:MAG TPA: hypothetical protein VGM39_16060 [Kofleriaceae bacterium]|jgi:hypothetical protein